MKLFNFPRRFRSVRFILRIDDCLSYSHGTEFSTPDQDNDFSPTESCAEKYNGAWWMRSCFYGHLNGINYNGPSPWSQGILWMNWGGLGLSHSEASMALKIIN